MQFSEIKQSTIILKGSTRISTLRGHLNSAYSTAPKELAEVFAAGLDQVADQQTKVTEALIALITTEDLKETEVAIESAGREAQRAALRVARSYADHQSEQATFVVNKLTDIPRDNAKLLAQRRQLDEAFLNAVKLHEKDDIAALTLLLDVARKYNEWTLEAQAAIAGSAGLIKSDKKRIKLQWVAIIIAIIALIATVINIILTHLKK